MGFILRTLLSLRPNNQWLTGHTLLLTGLDDGGGPYLPKLLHDTYDTLRLRYDLLFALDTHMANGIVATYAKSVPFITGKGSR